MPITEKTIRRLLAAALCVWTALVLYGSLSPGNDLPSGLWAWIPGFDKIAHFLFYLGEISLLLLVFRPRRIFAGLIVLGVILCSGIIELVQGAYLGRSCDIWDFATNSLGAVCGIFTAHIIDKYLINNILSSNHSGRIPTGNLQKNNRMSS